MRSICAKNLVEKQTGFDGYPNRQFASLQLFRRELIIRQKKFGETLRAIAQFETDFRLVLL
jgi:hypothetical protein